MAWIVRPTATIGANLPEMQIVWSEERAEIKRRQCLLCIALTPSFAKIIWYHCGILGRDFLTPTITKCLSMIWLFKGYFYSSTCCPPSKPQFLMWLLDTNRRISKWPSLMTKWILDKARSAIIRQTVRIRCWAVAIFDTSTRISFR